MFPVPFMISRQVDTYLHYDGLWRSSPYPFPNWSFQDVKFFCGALEWDCGGLEVTFIRFMNRPGLGIFHENRIILFPLFLFYFAFYVRLNPFHEPISLNPFHRMSLTFVFLYHTYTYQILRLTTLVLYPFASCLYATLFVSNNRFAHINDYFWYLFEFNVWDYFLK